MRDVLIKALGYRAAASTFTIAIAYFVTGSLELGAAVGGIEFVVKTIGYMGYELFWREVEREADATKV